MKRTIFAFLLSVPALFGCNHSKTNGFIDPFPNDDYQKKGFVIQPDEQISRAITRKESEILSSTNSINFDQYITRKESTIKKRNYMLAFAGVFKEGYGVNNEKSDETSTEYTMTEVLNENEPVQVINNQRLYSKKTSNNQLVYNYGKIDKKINEEVYTYFMNDEVEEEEENNAEEEEVGPKQSTNAESNHISKRITTTEHDIYKKTIDEPANINKPSGKEKDPWPENVVADSFYIKQSPFVFEADANTGADKNDNLILYKEAKEKYGTDGKLTLEDGREYRAMNNSLTVVKLKLISKKTSTQDEDKYPSDWYLVSYVRKYSETVITSDVIQPNVPVSYLNEPIIINYEEEIINFYNDDLNETQKNLTQKDLPKITKDEEKE